MVVITIARRALSPTGVGAPLNYRTKSSSRPASGGRMTDGLHTSVAFKMARPRIVRRAALRAVDLKMLASNKHESSPCMHRD